MAKPLPDLSTPLWTSALAGELEAATLSLARLDGRISASPVANAWSERASWTGLARALQLQGQEIEEIDLFARVAGLALPGRRPLASLADPLAGLAAWQSALAAAPGRHWREALPFTFTSPADWNERPRLVRALELTARHARADSGASAWLALPALLQALGLSRRPLPCLVTGDKALRLAPRDRAIVPRFLRGIRLAAETGLARLEAMEADRLRSAVALARERRPGALLALTAQLQRRPVTSPRAVAQSLRLTISGAGRLLQRAAALGLLVEITGRQAWRTYLTPDLAIAFGFIARPLGRPPALPRSAPDLEPSLAAFDAEMAALDAVLDRLGVCVPADNGGERE